MVTPLGCGVEPTWTRLARRPERRRAASTDFRGRRTSPARSPARSRAATAPTARSIPTSGWSRRSSARSTTSSSSPWPRPTQALDDAGWHPETDDDQMRHRRPDRLRHRRHRRHRTRPSIILHERGPRRISPFFIPGRLINLASGHVSIRTASRAPTTPWSPPARPAAHAIGDAARLIALGDADVMVAGGTESPITRLSLAGFAACRALSTNFNDDPTRASRPYDRTATASSWARGPASSCSKSSSTPRPAAPRSTPK